MPSIQQILVATDFSEPSSYALRQAIDLADSFHAKLDVLHVVEEPFSYVASSHGYLPELDMFRATLRDAARKQMDDAISADEVERLSARKFVVLGGACSEILRIAGEYRADLIVMGTHGRGAVLHALLGSVAERVVRHAACPVLTVRVPDNR